MNSWKLLSVEGIEIRLHWTLLLLFGYVFFMAAMNPRESFLVPLLWFILFASVALHELSHSLVAKSMGVTIEQIVLLPIGGMAVMKQAVFTPLQEFKMSVAGPLFNFAVCFLVLVFNVATDWFWFYDLNELMQAGFSLNLGLLFAFTISSVFWLNLTLGGFNLLPAIPMDGGRMLRSLLAMFMDYIQATRIATLISNFLMISLFIVGWFTGNWVLILISVFIIISSRAELEATVSNKLLSDFPLSKLVRQNYLIIEEDTSLDTVITDMIASRSLVAFSKKDHSISSVSIYDIQSVPRAKWKTTKFSKIAMEQHPVTEDHPASFALEKMRELGVEALPVLENNEIVGCVFKEDINVVLELLKLSKL